MTEETTATNGAPGGAQSSPSTISSLHLPQSTLQQQDQQKTITTTETETTTTTTATKTTLNYSMPSSCKRLRLSDEFINNNHTTVHHPHQQQQQQEQPQHEHLHQDQQQHSLQQHTLPQHHQQHSHNEEKIVEEADDGAIGEDENENDEEDDNEDEDDDNDEDDEDDDDDDDDDDDEDEDDEDDEEEDDEDMHEHVDQQQVGAEINAVDQHNNNKYSLNINNNIIYDHQQHHNHLHHHHHHHQQQQQNHHPHHHHHHQPHLHLHHHHHHHDHHHPHNHHHHQNHLHQTNHNPTPLQSQNHQQQQQMQQIEQQHDQTNHNHHQPPTLMNTTTETNNNHNNNNDLKHQNTDNLNNSHQQLQNSNWELFHKSINKLRRSQSGAEPNLLRSVLICNLLRKLERDMDEDGIKINYGPDGIPTIVNSNQEITMLDPPPTSLATNNQIAVTQPHATETQRDCASSSEGEDQSTVLVEPVVTTNTSSTNENPHLPIENDCVKHFLDLDMLSSGRVTPFPSITIKCTPDESNEPSNDNVDTLTRAQSTSPPRSPTPTPDDDCSVQDAFSITTLSSNGNSSTGAVSISDHHNSMTSVPSYLSLDNGLESSVIQSAVTDVTSLDNHTTTILDVSSSTIKSSDQSKSTNNTISGSNNIASPASYALLYTNQNGEESFADLDWSLYDFDLLMSNEYVGSSHASSSSSSASSTSSNGSVTQWSTTLPSSSSSSLSPSSPLSSTLDVVITNIYD